MRGLCARLAGAAKTDDFVQCGRRRIIAIALLAHGRIVERWNRVAANTKFKTVATEAIVLDGMAYIPALAAAIRYNHAPLR